MANFLLKDGTIAILEGQKFPKQTFTAEASRRSMRRACGGAGESRDGGAGGTGSCGAADNKRAEVVGEKTFGEGAQQKTFELPDGAALILTLRSTSRLGETAAGCGVTPGVLVASTAEDAVAEEDTTTHRRQQPLQKPAVAVMNSSRLDCGDWRMAKALHRRRFVAPDHAPARSVGLQHAAL